MITVAKYAKESEVSVQTIYRRLNSVKQKGYDGLTEKKSGILYITEKGVHILNDELNEVKQVFNSVKHAESEEIIYLREQNTALQEELSKEREHSRAQSEMLAELAKQLAELSRNNQILLGAEQSRSNPALLPKKKGILNIFKK